MSVSLRDRAVDGKRRLHQLDLRHGVVVAGVHAAGHAGGSGMRLVDGEVGLGGGDSSSPSCRCRRPRVRSAAASRSSTTRLNRCSGSLLRPVVEHRLGHVPRVVVLSVPLHAHRVDADQRRALAPARAIDHPAWRHRRPPACRCRRPSREECRSSPRARQSWIDGHLLRDRGRVGVLVVFGDHDQGERWTAAKFMPS